MRLFIAIELPQEVRGFLSGLVSQLRAELPPVVRWARPDGIHLTLKFLGETNEEQVGGVKEALTQAAARAGKMRLAVKGLGMFPGQARPRVVWVGLEGDTRPMAQLQEAVERALEPLGFPREGRSFTPHLTLGRLSERARPADRARVGRLLAETPPVEGPAFEAHEVSLMQSILRPEGAEYRRLWAVPTQSEEGT